MFRVNVAKENSGIPGFIWIHTSKSEFRPLRETDLVHLTTFLLGEILRYWRKGDDFPAPGAPSWRCSNLQPKDTGPFLEVVSNAPCNDEIDAQHM